MPNTVGRLLVEIGVQLQDLKRGLGQAEALISKTGKRLQSVGRSLTTGVTLPLAAATGAVIKFGSDFEDAMTRSTAIMGNLSKEMRSQMEEAAFAVSESVSASSTQAAEAYFFLASAGLDAAQSVAAIPQVAKFAEAGAFDLARATDLLTDAQSALGLTIRDDVQKNMENMVRVSDVLIKANTLANATAEQFSESLTNKLGASLRLLNKDVEEGVAVLAVYADQGLKGAAAGERASIALRDLQRAALANRTDFAAMNISVFDATGTMRSMSEIISDLERAMAGMSDETRRATLTQLGFQERSIQAILQLVGTSSAIKGYESALRDAAGTTDTVANRQMQSFSKQMKLLKNDIANAAIELSRSLLPALKDLSGIIETGIGYVRDFSEWFGSLDEGVRKTIIASALLVAALGPVLVIVGAIASAIAALIPIFASIASVIAVVATPALAGLAIVIGTTLLPALVGMAGTNESVVGRLKTLWRDTQYVFLKVSESIVHALNVVTLNAFADTEAGIKKSLREMQEASYQFAGGVRDDTKDIREQFIATAEEAKRMTENVKREFESLRFEQERSRGRIGSGDIPEPFRLSTPEETGNRIKGRSDFNDIVDSVIKSTGSGGTDGRASAVEQFMDRVRSAVGLVQSGLSTAKGIARSFGNAFSEQADAVNGIFGDLKTNLAGITAEERLFGQATDTNIARSEIYRQAIVDLVANGVSPASQQVQELREQVIDLNDSWDVFANTVIDVSAEIKNAIYDTFQTLVRGIGDAVARAIVYGEDLGKAMIAVLKSVAAQLISLLVQLVIQIVANAIAAAVGAKTKASAEIGANAGITYSAVFAANAGIPLVGPIGAAAAAAAAVKALLAGSAAAIASGIAVGATTLAEGGIVTKPTLALLGEGKETEVVQPLSRLRALLGLNGSGSGRPLILQTTLDGEVVAERVMPHFVDLLKSNGILTT